MGDGTRIDGRAIRDASVPATIEDAVLARFERLSPEAQAAARTATVIGRCFVTDVLAGIMDVPAEDLDAPLLELVDQSFLIPPGARELWDFRHELLRDTLYRGLPPGAQRRLHARVAEFGAELEGASEIHASVHYERAGLRAQAFRTAVAGARAAAALSSHREAFELYRRAVANMPHDLPPGEAGEIWEAYWVEGFAIDLSDEPIEAMHMARARLPRGGRGGRCRQPADRARRRIPPRGVPTGPAPRHLAEARAELDAMLPSPERDDAMVGLLTEETQVATEAMDLADARSAAIEGAAIARRLGDEGSAMFAESWLGMIDVIEGRIDAGLELMTSAAVASRGGRLRGRRHHGVPEHVNECDPGNGVPSRGGVDRRRHALRRQDPAVALPPRDGRRRSAARLGGRAVGRCGRLGRPGAGEPGLHPREVGMRGGARLRGIRSR